MYSKLITISYLLCTLQEENKLEVAQSLVIHESLIKHKGVLDQFRKGLAILGVLEY